MIVREQKRKYAVQFSSLAEIVRYVQDNPPAWGHESRSGADRWSGGLNFKDTCDLALRGWEAGVKELDAVRTAIHSATVKTKRMNFAGEYPEVPRAIAGDPMSMVSRGHERRNRPSLTIVAAIGGTMEVTAKRMANYGGALTAVIDRIESSGTRVELLAHWGNAVGIGSLDKWGVTWTVKQVQDALDLSALAFSLGHAGAMRKIGFAMMETYPKAIPGYGGTLASVDPELIVDCPDPVVFLRGVQGDREGKTQTITGALEYVEEQLAKYEQKEAA